MNEMLGSFTSLNENFTGDNDAFMEMVAKGFVREGLGSPEEAVETVTNAWNGTQYLAIANMAWQSLLTYYATISQ